MKDLNFPKVKKVNNRTISQDLIPMKPNEVGEELGKLYKWIHNELKKLDRKGKRNES